MVRQAGTHPGSAGREGPLDRLAELALSLIVGLLLLSLLGYWGSLLLPPQWRPWRFVLAPVLGLSLFSVLAYWLSIIFPMNVAIWPLAALSTGGALWALIRERSRAAGLRAELGELSLASVVFFLGLLIAVLPAALRPELLSIGPNWDIEIYLPLADYLREHAVGFSWTNPAGLPFGPAQDKPFGVGEATSPLQDMPFGDQHADGSPVRPNPLLWRLDFFDTRWAGTAFSLLQAGVDSLTGLQAYQSFSPMLSLVYAVSLLGVYFFYRSVFGFGMRSGLLGAAVMAVNSAPLFAVLWSFGQQAGSLAVLPLAIAAAIEAIERPGLRAFFLAGLALSALLNFFAPVAVVYAGVLAAVCSYKALHLSKLRQVALACFGFLAASALLSPMAYFRAGWRVYYFIRDGGASGLTVGPEVERFPHLAWAYGLVSERSAGIGQPLDATLPSEFSAAVAVAGVALTCLAIFKRKDYRIASCAAASWLLLALMRWPLDYPYGYLKLMPSLAFLLVGLAVAGIEDIVCLGRRALTDNSPHRLRVAWLAAASAILPMGLLLAGLAGTLQEAVRASPMKFRSLEALRGEVGNSSVYVAFHPELRGPLSGAIVYFLRKADLYGQVRTGYSTFFRLSPSGGYDYALLTENDHRLDEALEGEAVWRGSGLALYRWKEGLMAYQEYGLLSVQPVIDASAGRGGASDIRVDKWDPRTGYPVFAGWSPPLLGALARTSDRASAYPAVDSAAPLGLPMPKPAQTVGQANSLGESVGATLVITLASTGGADVVAQVGGKTKEIKTQPGVSSYVFGPVTYGDDEQLRLTAKYGKAYVKSAQLLKGEATEGNVTVHQNMAVVQAEVSDELPGLPTIEISYAGPLLKPVLDVYGSEGNRDHFGYWELPVSDERVWTVRLRVDFLQKEVLDARDGRQLLGWKGDGSGNDGSYTAYLFFWSGRSMMKSLPLLDFRLTDSAVPKIGPSLNSIAIL